MLLLGFQHLTSGPADVNVSEKHVWLLLLHKNIFSLKYFVEIASQSYFSCTYNGAEKHITCKPFENAASKAKTTVIATVHFFDDDVSFYDSPGMLIHKTIKLCINSTWIPLLINGFVLVK